FRSVLINRETHTLPARRCSDLLDQAARLAKQNGIKIAYVNPCFEFRLFLHQRDHGGDYLRTDQAIAKMKGLRCCFTEGKDFDPRSEEHTSELQSRFELVCRLLL